jgi:hypothetical protein
LGGIAAVATVAGAGASTYGQIQAGKYEAKVAENNAELAAAQRAAVLQQGQEEASQVEALGRRTGATAVAQMAASGVDTATGSAANVEAQSIANAAVDAETIRANAARAAWGLEAEEEEHLARAKMAKRASVLGGIATGVSGLGGALGVYGALRRK